MPVYLAFIILSGVTLQACQHHAKVSEWWYNQRWDKDEFYRVTQPKIKNQ